MFTKLNAVAQLILQEEMPLTLNKRINSPNKYFYPNGFAGLEKSWSFPVNLFPNYHLFVAAAP